MKVTPIAILIPLCFESESKKIWMQKRISNDDLNGLWEFPGGKVEPSELPSEAAVRELKEEVQVTLLENKIHLMKVYYHTLGNGKNIQLHAFIHQLRDEEQDLYPLEGWSQFDENWKGVFSSKIPPLNLEILSDLWSLKVL